MNRINYILVNLFLLSVFSVASYCQTDTEFWFVAPEVSQNGSQDLDRPIFLRMSSFDHPSVVTISQSANPAFAPITVTIAANSSQTVDLTPFIDIIENKPPDNVLNYGLYIKATKPIQAYYEVASLETNYNPELFALKGKNALGTHFIIPGQVQFYNDNNYTPRPYSSFDIVATRDSTTVTINPKNNIAGHNENIPFNIILNKGQTYSAAGLGDDPIYHLVGTEVWSDKPIAITIKDDMLNGIIGCADLIGDQIVPVNIIGTVYNAVAGFLGTGEKETVTITGTEDNTNFTVWNSGFKSGVVNKGGIYEFIITGNSCQIETDKPVYVYQVSGIGCELGSALLPHVECTGSRQVAFTRTTKQQLSMMIFTTEDAIDGFTLNDNPGIIKSSDFSLIPGKYNNWYFARLSFDTKTIPVDQTCIIQNNKNFFHLGVLEGDIRTGCSYGFFSDYNSLNLGSDISICPGDSAELDAGYGKEPYRWSNGSTGRSILVRDSGTYWVIARLGNCEVRDTIHVSFVTPNVLSLGPDKYICGSGSARLYAGEGFISYKWNTGSTNKEIIVNTPGIYSVETVSPEGCIQHDSVKVILIDTNIRITISGNPCEGDSAILTTDSRFDEFWWYDSTGLMSLTNNNKIRIFKSGTYHVRAGTWTGCWANSDTIEVKFSTNKFEIFSNPPSDSGKLDFGEVNILDDKCLTITISNKSDESYTLSDVFLKNNTVFSIPQSQFAMDFAPGESRQLIICFSPVKLGEQSDTLFISDTCVNLSLILHGVAIGNEYMGLSKCNIQVILVTEDTYLHEAIINPNDKIEVYNILGIKVLEAEHKDKIDVSGLSAGVYFLRIADKVVQILKL
ncbi:MAG: T9SS type A sorting domain-containing protein [Bacteroidetes bacterium]|nr:MAG: T9SS type A sorting domain-containing protein [Bacteroidota bacterium]